ncbi:MULTISPECIES: hypothetical protein [unclassified Endozoicomonas]|uniref:hypothetical protein n=1 Tax=unclassified Endozoicomonas TaxID=2644528 RepID=UPI003BB60370
MSEQGRKKRRLKKRERRPIHLTEEEQALGQELKELLDHIHNGGDIVPTPEGLLFAEGLMLGKELLLQGHIGFEGWVKQMKLKLGDEITSSLKMIYPMLMVDETVPDELADQMDSSKTVRNFDVHGCGEDGER